MEGGKGMTKYYDKGIVKVVGGTVYAIGNNGRYQLDFYHDYDDAVVAEKECSKEEALKTYVKLNGTDEGFYDYEK